jgi:hypothetical protein
LYTFLTAFIFFLFGQVNNVLFISAWVDEYPME